MSFPLNKIVCGDALTLLKEMSSDSIDVCLTSPPYWGLRDYGVEGQLGLESHPNLYIHHLAEVFSEVKRVLKKTGSLWLNIGDTYFGSRSGAGAAIDPNTISFKGKQNIAMPKKSIRAFKSKEKWLQPKQKMLIPERLAISLQEQGWILRNTIIWFKPNHMPSSVQDRFTNSYENIYFFVKSRRYYFDLDVVRQPCKPLNRWGGNLMKIPLKTKAQKSNCAVQYRERLLQPNPKGKNPGDMWTINTKPFKGAHFATFPQKLVIQVLKCACPKDGVVLDPFVGSGTTCYVARKIALNYIGFDLKPEYCKMTRKRLMQIPERLETFIKK